MKALLNNFRREDFFYLSSLFIMLLSQYLTVISNIKYIGAFISLMYILVSKNKKFDKRYVRWILLFTAFSLLSFLWSLNIKVSGIVFIAHLFPYYLLTFATMKYFSSYKELKNILVVVFLCGLALMLYVVNNIDEFVLGVRLGASLNEDDPTERVWNVNTIGMCFCYSVYAGWILFKNFKKTIVKCFILVSIIIMMLASLLSGSRKVLLMLAIPIGFILYKKLGNNFVFGFIIAVIAFVSAYYLIMNVEFFYSTIGNRTEDMIAILTGNATGYEDNSRVYLAQYGLQWWKDNPIFGVGINCFKVLSNATSMFRGKMFYAHNNYIELLVDVGIVGFLLYYRGYFYLLKESFRGKTEAMSWVFIMTVVIFALDIGNVSYYDMRVQLLLVILFVVLRLERNNIRIKKHETS